MVRQAARQGHSGKERGQGTPDNTLQEPNHLACEVPRRYALGTKQGRSAIPEQNRRSHAKIAKTQEGEVSRRGALLRRGYEGQAEFAERNRIQTTTEARSRRGFVSCATPEDGPRTTARTVCTGRAHGTSKTHSCLLLRLPKDNVSAICPDSPIGRDK